MVRRLSVRHRAVVGIERQLAAVTEPAIRLAYFGVITHSLLTALPRDLAPCGSRQPSDRRPERCRAPANPPRWRARATMPQRLATPDRPAPLSTGLADRECG